MSQTFALERVARERPGAPCRGAAQFRVRTALEPRRFRAVRATQSKRENGEHQAIFDATRRAPGSSIAQGVFIEYRGLDPLIQALAAERDVCPLQEGPRVLPPGKNGGGMDDALKRAKVYRLRAEETRTAADGMHHRTTCTTGLTARPCCASPTTTISWLRGLSKGHEVGAAGRRPPDRRIRLTRAGRKRGTDETQSIRRWRMKADELKAAAENMTDRLARIGLFNARSYEEMASRAEARLQGDPDQNPTWAKGPLSAREAGGSRSRDASG